jgi:hypothetical protein
LLEDCALALFSAPADRPIGVCGDAAIYSFRKSLALPDGGALVLRRGGVRPLPAQPAPAARDIFRASLSVLRHFAVDRAAAIGVYPLLARLPGVAPRPRLNDRPALPRPDIPSRYYFDAGMGLRRISRLTAGLLRAVDRQSVVVRRRENYAFLQQAIAEAPGVRLLFDSLPPGVCPLTMPVCVDDRHWWRQELARRRIATIPWWSGYHRALRWDDFPEACALKDTIIGLPIHHQLTSAHMRAIAAAVGDIARRAAATRPPETGRIRHASPTTRRRRTSAVLESTNAT